MNKRELPVRRISEPLVMVVICLLAAIVRLVFLFQWKETILFSSPVGDEMNFHQTALSLIGQSSSSEDVFLYQPLYSFFLALVYSIFGVNITFVRIVQLLLGTANSLVFYLLGLQLAGKKVGWLSALMVSLYGPMIFFGVQMLDPVLCVPFTAGAYACLFMAINRNRSFWFLPAGLLLGLAMMGRPNLSVVLLVGVVGILLLPWTIVRRGFALIVAASGLIVGILPSWIHNAVKGGEFIPVSTAGGHSFYIGNCPSANGMFHVPRGLGIELRDHTSYRMSFVRIAEREMGKTLSPSQVSSYWFRRGLQFYRDQPAEALRLLGRKALFAILSEEIAIHHSFAFARDLAPWLNILFSFGVIFPFSLVGMIFVSDPTHKIALLSWSAVAYWLTLVMFYVADRYRIVLLPMLIPLAVVGFIELWHRLRQPSWRGLIGPVLVLIAAFIATYLPVLPRGYRSNIMAFSYNWMGALLMEQGKLDEAERSLQRAVQLTGHNYGPIPSTTWMKLGCLYERRGDLDGARNFFLRSAKAHRDNMEVRFRLARLAEIKGNYQEAINWLEQVASLQIDPGHTRALISRIKEKYKVSSDIETERER